MKKLVIKIMNFALSLLIIFNMIIPTFAKGNNSIPYSDNTFSSYKIIEQVDTPYGTAYYVTKNSTIKTRSVWDIVDILMAGASWADLFAEPSWANFGWAVLDTGALLPALPSSAYFRKGGKTLLKVDEVVKFAKTPKGKKVISTAMKTYKYSDGISSRAIKDINKKFKGTEGKKVLELFKEAANKGLVGATSQSGIKKITPNSKIGKQYTHEIKIINKQYGDYRIFGYKTKSGEWVFDLFREGLH